MQVRLVPNGDSCSRFFMGMSRHVPVWAQARERQQHLYNKKQTYIIKKSYINQFDVQHVLASSYSVLLSLTRDQFEAQLKHRPPPPPRIRSRPWQDSCPFFHPTNSIGVLKELWKAVAYEFDCNGRNVLDFRVVAIVRCWRNSTSLLTSLARYQSVWILCLSWRLRSVLWRSGKKRLERCSFQSRILASCLRLF